MDPAAAPPAAVAPGLLVTAVAVAGAQVGGAAFDRWIHPRGQAFDPARHYKDANGEVYYQAENDIEKLKQGLEAVTARMGQTGDKEKQFMKIYRKKVEARIKELEGDSK